MTVVHYAHGTQDYFEYQKFEKMMEDKKHYRSWSSKKLMGRIGTKMIEAAFKVKSLLGTTETHTARTNYFMLDDGEGEADNSYLATRATGSDLTIRYFTNHSERWKKIRDTARELVKPFRMKEEDATVIVNFSFMMPNGPEFYEREIDCPKWEDVIDNYPGCAEKLAWLFSLKKPEDFGKLIFWNGKPGTGKTYAIRALLQEWKKEAEFYYVMDPEIFFEKPGYMFEVLLRDDDGPAYVDEEPDPEADENIEVSIEKIKDFIKKHKDERTMPIKLLILEDSADFILTEKMVEMGGAMGRLLNLTEGLIGQGFRVMILVTTNQDKKEIYPAFTRKGRCLQALEFPTMTLPQAKEWAEKNKIKTPRANGTFTLAELYAAKNEVPGEEDEEESLAAIGFQAKQEDGKEEKPKPSNVVVKTGKKGAGPGRGRK